MTATVPQVSTVQAAQLRGLIELERVRRSPLFWAERYAFTRDEKDPAKPYKPLIDGPPAVHPQTLEVRSLDDGPDDFLRWLVVLWEAHKRMVVPKSRQLRLSWWAVAMAVWLAQARPAQRIALQSQKAEAADKLVMRAQVILELQLKVAPYVPWPRWRRRFGLVAIQHGGLMGISRIEGIAQGEHKIRGESFSMIVSDEMGFQDQAEAAYAAAIPILEANEAGQEARYLAISSAAGGSFFEKLCGDNI